MCSPEVHTQYPPGALCAKAWDWSDCLSRSTSNSPHLPWSCGCYTSNSSLQVQLMQQTVMHSSWGMASGLAKVPKHGCTMSLKHPKRNCTCKHLEPLLSQPVACQLCSPQHQLQLLAPVLRAMQVISLGMHNTTLGRCFQDLMCVMHSCAGMPYSPTWHRVVLNDDCRVVKYVSSATEKLPMSTALFTCSVVAAVKGVNTPGHSCDSASAAAR